MEQREISFYERVEALLERIALALEDKQKVFQTLTKNWEDL